MEELGNTNKRKSPEHYSGVNFFLNEIYYRMASNQLDDKSIANTDEIHFQTDGVMRGVKSDMQDKLKNVQNATALKVLNRFYKKTEFVD